MGHVFFSYSRQDSKTVQPIVQKLGNAGLDVWIDRQDIKPGKPWRGQIVKAIDTADSFVLNLSPKSAASENVRTELDLAKEAPDPFVLPVVVEDTQIPTEMRYQLAGIQRIEYYINPERGYEQLEESLLERQTERQQTFSELPTHKEIEIIIDGETVSSFDKDKQQALLTLLAEVTGTSPADLDISRIEIGSVHVFIQAPTDTAYELKAQALNKDSRLFGAGISALRFVNDQKYISLEGATRISQPPPTKASTRKLSPKPFIVLLAILGLAAILFAGMRVFDINIPIYTQTNTPTSTLTQTTTPTHTDIPPTNTPSPTFTITPSSTPTKTSTITGTATPTPEVVIEFWANPEKINAGDCTTISWHVENAEKVIFGEKEQEFDGSHYECLCKDERYTLTVIHKGGTEENRQVNVEVVGSCATATSTPDTTPPPAPKQLKPVNGSDLGCVASAMLRWEAVSDPSGIDQYQVELQRHPEDNKWNGAPGSIFTGINGTEKEISVECGWEYRWRVRAVDNQSNIGEWSGWFSFVAPLS